MPFYHRLGKIPKKKHTTMYKADGTLYKEELVSSKGFSGIYSNKYHIHMPTRTIEINELDKVNYRVWNEAPLKHYHFYTDKLKKDGDFFSSRIAYLHNSHCVVLAAKPNKNPDYFYKNSFAHEFIFVHRGSGVLLSDYGKLFFEPGDQIVIPQGTIYQMHFDDFDDNKIVVVESDTAFEIPKHYKNEYGQLEEHAPFEERDFKIPEYMDAIDEKGKFSLIIKAGHRLFEYIIPEHPFDVVGWDGFLYPFSFNIKDYNPKVGRIHLPPPVHLLYTTQHFVLCNFNPRPFDWHEQAIPAPYYHSNIDSAEMLYYIEGEFMSRKGVGEGSITLHPMGIPHGPQPGKTEESVGAKFTHEYALMLDTFEPLNPTLNVLDANDENYYKSWMD
ncbi:homogentisate 1,2-dioxygenase [Candidatus Kapaibacterium sp.]